MDQLWFDGSERARFSFVAGDIEQPNLGIDETQLKWLARRLTHVIHCAASVSFDDPYAASFSANVTGTINALTFSLGLQEAPDSPFISHVGIETSYIHGRQVKQSAREDEVVFPRAFYNNHYELTKALGVRSRPRGSCWSRAYECCSSVRRSSSASRGRATTAGDTKVLNAPVNIFGRTQQAISGTSSGKSGERSRRRRCWPRWRRPFPADPAAQINLIPVDWVVKGIVHCTENDRPGGRRAGFIWRPTIDSRAGSIRQHRQGGDRAEDQARRADHAPEYLAAAADQGVEPTPSAQAGTRARRSSASIFGGYGEWGPAGACGGQ